MPAFLPPSPTPDTAPYWEAARRRQLALQRCADCRAFRFYPGPVCPGCGSGESAWEPVSGRGVIHSYVIVHRATHPVFAGEVPYVVVLVELDGTGGIRIPSRLVGAEPGEARIGLPVEVDFQDVTPEATVPVFRPARRGP
jgi:uncharacterized OB-fold protein